jgi:hypothetical protein
MRLNTALALLLLSPLVLSACGGRDAPDAAAAAQAPAADAPAAEVAEDAPAVLPPLPAGDFRITSLTLGKAVDAEGQVANAQDVFAQGDTIYAAVVSVGSSDGLALTARWTAADGTEVAQAAQSLAPATPLVTTFSIAQAEPWPVGGYQVEIAINGRVVETRAFQVQ